MLHDVMFIITGSWTYGSCRQTTWSFCDDSAVSQWRTPM